MKYRCLDAAQTATAVSALSGKLRVRTAQSVLGDDASKPVNDTLGVRHAQRPAAHAGLANQLIQTIYNDDEET